MAEADVIALRSESFDEKKALTITHPLERWKKMKFMPGEYTIKEIVKPIIKGGKLLEKYPTLEEIRAFADKEKATFWDEYKRLDKPHIYKVDLSDGLYQLKTSMISEIRGG